MMLAVKHLDPVLGIDIHFIITPPGAVVPIPHPHIGIVFDPFDYLPILGATVMVNGLPRAQAGTGGRTLPPHFPIGGVFAKPPGNENETFMGSSTVVVDEEPFTYMLLPVLSCQDIGMPSPPRKRGPGAKTLLLPTTIALSIPAGPPVFVGGPPTISLSGLFTRLALGVLLKGLKKLRRLQKASRKMEALSDRIHQAADKFMKKLGPRARDLVHKGICTLTGHPVDVATGRVVTEAVDWELPGPIHLKFERNYSSSMSWRDSVVGWGWSHSLDLAVWEEEGQVVYRAEDGREIEFDTTGFDTHRLPIGAEAHEPIDRLTLRRVGELRWQVENVEGMTHEFCQVPGETRAGLCRVVRTRNRAGHQIQYEYDGQGLLRWVRDSAGRRVLFEHDAAGRLTRVALPHPRETGWVTHNRYVYSEAGQLMEAQDALGHPTRFAYEGGLLVRETDRTGLSFHFEYDGKGPNAWCVRTWGDGGIFHHKLRYDRQARATEVTNSLGHTTTYLYNAWGVVEREVDALGGEKRFEYDEALRLIAETNPLGHTTRYEYDIRGNRTKTVGPDGASVSMRYNALNLPEEATDANGGSWHWRYDTHGQQVQETNPLGETTRYEYSDGLLIAEVNQGSERTEYTYDSHYNLTRIRLPTGAQMRIEYDKRGRRVVLRDARGGEELVRYDALDRPVRVEGPGSEVWESHYDAEGNVLEVKGPLRHVRLGYTGFHWLSFQEEAGTRIAWQHDTEGALAEVTNEAGEVYRFLRDELGRVVRQEGFDQAAWLYQYDAAGRLQQVTQPSGRTQHLIHDAAGRLTRVQYSDGTFRAFRFRADGALVEAENESGKVNWARDALGRVVVEKQGDMKITSRYSPAGHRVEVESNLGTRQILLRDPLGAVKGVTHTSPGQSDWLIHMERDAGGLEVARWMPGGVVATWRYDEAGCPTERCTVVGGRTAALRSYRWRTGGQLSSLLDGASSRAIEYFHDARGRLVGVKRPDGSIQHRTMDAVGNLYRHPGQMDKHHGPGGRLLQAYETRYTHDLDGNLVEKHTPQGTWHYRWNGAGLLTEVQRPDGTRVSMSYDALARRTRKTILGAEVQGQSSTPNEVRFVWDGHVPLHELASNEGLTTWIFEPESFTPLAKEDTTGRYSVVTDHLGTPTEMYDELGKQAWRMQLDAFGVGKPDVTTIQHCPWRWPGQYEDEETGLHYNRFRYYDASAGRYISQDPLGLAAGLNFYNYPEDPLVATDPLGLTRCYQSGPQAPGNLLFNPKLNKNGAINLTEWRRTIKSPDIRAERIKFLGENSVKVDEGTWRSLDGTRQFRVVPADYLGKHGIGQPLVPNTPHVHFEHLGMPGAGGNKLKLIKNVHVPLVHL